MALRDPLTNAANWRFFEDFANREIQRDRRNKRSITIVYFDLDNFKTVNDTLGHDVGDDLLRTVSEITQSSLRPSDMLARVGGDEFALLLPSTDFSGAEAVLRRVRENVLNEMNSHGWPVTMSMGAVTFSTLPSTVGPMLKRADEVMYSVKRSGKNNLIHEQWPPVQENGTTGINKK
jgi:diguanylate cyclase (GGDEF)-like protein